MGPRASQLSRLAGPRAVVTGDQGMAKAVLGGPKGSPEDLDDSTDSGVEDRQMKARRH